MEFLRLLAQAATTIFASFFMIRGFAQFYAAYVDGASGSLPTLHDEIWSGEFWFVVPAICLLVLLQFLFYLARKRLMGWRCLLTLPVAAFALLGLSWFLGPVHWAETWWWNGVALVGGTLPVFVVAAWVPPSTAWSWRALQGVLLLLVGLLPAQLGLWAHALLPQDEAVLRQEQLRRSGDVVYNKVRGLPCPPVDGAVRAVMASGLVARLAGPLPEATVACHQPAFLGYAADETPVAVWTIYLSFRSADPWVVTGSTSLAGARSLEGALSAMGVTKASAKAIALEGPLSPAWRVSTAQKELVYRLDTARVEQQTVDCDQLAGALAALKRATGLTELEFCRAIDVSGSWFTATATGPDRKRFVQVWLGPDQLLGYADFQSGPTPAEAIAAVKALGYRPLDDHVGFPLAGPDPIAWQVPAWDLPSYRFVLVEVDWKTRTARKVAP